MAECKQCGATNIGTNYCPICKPERINEMLVCSRCNGNHMRSECPDNSASKSYCPNCDTDYEVGDKCKCDVSSVGIPLSYPTCDHGIPPDTHCSSCHWNEAIEAAALKADDIAGVMAANGIRGLKK